MDQRAVLNLIVKKDDREYVFSMPHGANFGEAYDVAFSMLQEIADMSKRAVERVKRVDDSKGSAKEAEVAPS